VAGDHAAGKHPRVMIAQRQGLAGVGPFLQPIQELLGLQ
jgi:hypothetical protein